MTTQPTPPTQPHIGELFARVDADLAAISSILQSYASTFAAAGHPETARFLISNVDSSRSILGSMKSLTAMAIVASPAAEDAAAHGVDLFACAYADVEAIRSFIEIHPSVFAQRQGTEHLGRVLIADLQSAGASLMRAKSFAVACIGLAKHGVDAAPNLEDGRSA